jgi:AcrR family transcriptional regulator
LLQVTRQERAEGETDRLPTQAGTVQDARLRQAAVAVLARDGWTGLTMEAVAEEASLSRVTVWRLGATRDSLIADLLRGLEEDYRRALWPALTAAGSARDRLDLALSGLFEVAEAHLPLLLASDQVFHKASASGINFNEPFTRIFRDGLEDGSLSPPGGDPGQAADLLFNTVCWAYTHLRGRHDWDPTLLGSRLKELVMRGLVGEG